MKGIFARFRKRSRGERDRQEKLPPPHIEVGRGTYGNPKVRSWGEGAALKIGAFCSIAEDVTILLGGEHRMEWVTTYPFNVKWDAARHITGHPVTRGDVVIGNDVWIGFGAMILSGVTIGDGAVIGARTLVMKNVPPYAIAAGHPAVVVRKRFDDATIDRLLKIRWWDWPDEKIERFLPRLLNSDLEAFLAATESE